MQAKTVWAVVLVSSVALGCDAEKEKAKIAEIQKLADDRIAKIQSEAQEKVAAAEKRIEQMQSELADAGAAVKAEADTEVAKAKSDADKLATEAAEALAKARKAYKEMARSQLGTIQKELDEVRAKEASANRR